VPSPIWSVRDIPVYALAADLPDEQQEHGDLAVTVVPATFWIFLDGVWGPVTSTTSAELATRVTKLESRLACLADCLTQETP